MNLLNSKIETIKLIRSFCGFGLYESKIIAEIWEQAFHNDFVTSNLNEILTLGSLCTMLKSGEWTWNEKHEIIVHRVITPQDVLNLRQ